MKIAIVIDRYGDIKNGGIQSTRRFVEELRRGNEVTVIAAGDPEEGLASLPSFFIPFFRRRMIENGIFFAWPDLEVIEPVILEADVVHIQFPFLLGWKVARLAKEYGKPLICSYHVQPENILMNIGIRSPYLINRLHRFFVNGFYNQADVVISPSVLGRDELTAHGLTVPCRVVSNGYISAFARSKPARKHNPRGMFVILSVGRLSREKNHTLLVEAVRSSRHCDRIMLVIVGEGSEYDLLDGIMKTLPHALLTGQLSREELLAKYAAADLYVHPSLVELESLAVLEAMAQGLPIIVSDSPTSAARQFASDESQIFRYDDADSLRGRIDHFIENRDDLEKAAARSREIVKGYTIEASVKKLLAIYRESAGIPKESEAETFDEVRRVAAL